MSNNKRWRVVVIYTLFLFISLPFVRQIWDFIGDRAGIAALFVLYLFTIGYIYNVYRKTFIAVLLLIAGFFIFRFINPPIVRIHFIEYGILGWLSYWAGGKKAFFYVVIIAILDEIVQGLLPSRYYDIKDIYINIAGGGVGFLLRAYAG